MPPNNNDVALVTPAGQFVRQFMENGLNVNELRTNGLLRQDEWKAFDDAVVDVARQRLNGVADLQALGLVRDLGGLGVMVDEWETISDMNEAEVDMAAVTEGEEDSVDFSVTGVPIPIVHKNYRINLRRLLASRRNGSSVDTIQAEVCARKVMDKLEDMLFNGYSIKARSYSFNGYTSFSSRTQVTIDGQWDVASTDNIIADVESLLEAADAIYYFGPFYLYVPTNFWSRLRSEQNSYTGSNYLQRLKQYAEIAAVKPADVLEDDEIVMVQMTRDTIDLAVGSDITNIEWQTMGGLVQHMKVMAAMAPRIKADANGSCGVIHGKESS
jgi:uncharacterized linocin/CFP29 family protein